MKRYSWLLAAAFLAAPVACQKTDDGPQGTMSQQKGTPPAADNTKVNERDPSSALPTPMDQGNNAGDLDTTQRIRKALVADDSLSSEAKNVKIITSDGVVSLRGPVKTDAERRTIEAAARQAAGSNRVEDHLDVKATQ
jgi:hyperosmotically inducible periplasmic protein